jgi:hypothetical protein
MNYMLKFGSSRNVDLHLPKFKLVSQVGMVPALKKVCKFTCNVTVIGFVRNTRDFMPHVCCIVRFLLNGKQCLYGE